MFGTVWSELDFNLSGTHIHPIRFIWNDNCPDKEKTMAYTCKNCGAVADAPGHLCNPCADKTNCSFCGAPQVDPKHICKDKLSAMKYVCEGCGRVAMEEKHLCSPSKIE